MNVKYSLSAAAALSATTAASAAALYSDDFQSAVGSEWSTNFGGGLALDGVPADLNRRFLGRGDGDSHSRC